MSTINSTPIIAFKSAEIFETWLETNFDTCNGIWLKIFKKDSGEQTVTYAQALDVALCFGWIDGQKSHSTKKHFYKSFVHAGQKVFGLK